MTLELVKYMGSVFGIYADARPRYDYWQYLSDEQYQTSPARSANGTVIVNGIALPQSVIDQLRRFGFNPEWCTPSELLAAEQDALIDGVVFDDPNGDNFLDKLELSEDEKEDDDDELNVLSCPMDVHICQDEDMQQDYETHLPAIPFHKALKKRRDHGSHYNGGSYGAEMHDGMK